MTITQKERFLSTELFDCPVCGMPTVLVESQLRDHIGCLAGHYDMYGPTVELLKTNINGYNLHHVKVGKYRVVVVPNKYVYKKELITTVDGCFIRTTHCDDQFGTILTYAEIFDAEFNLQFDSDKFVDIMFEAVSAWVGNYRLM